jgi:protein gp37
VIVGGESGPGARPMDLAWARDLIEQCRAVGTAVFVKQLGSRLARDLGATGKGEQPEYWPPDLRIREYPATARPA